jgi:hypothetical protein
MGSVWAFLRKPAMRAVGLVFLAECGWWPVLGAAQDAGETEKIRPRSLAFLLADGATAGS